MDYKAASKSTMFALQGFREKGMLDRDKMIDYSGRSNDVKFHKEMDRLGVDNQEDKVKLEYRDKAGRLMTQKQAFRYMCWTFHGKKPSKKKMAKMHKKDAEAHKAAWRDPIQAPSYKMQQIATKVSNTPYVDLTYKSGKN